LKLASTGCDIVWNYNPPKGSNADYVTYGKDEFEQDLDMLSTRFSVRKNLAPIENNLRDAGL
jgi:hypothetical protein